MIFAYFVLIGCAVEYQGAVIEDISDKYVKNSTYNISDDAVRFTIKVPETKPGEWISLCFNENVNYATVIISTTISDKRAGLLEFGVLDDMWDGDIVYKHDIRFDPETVRNSTHTFSVSTKHPFTLSYMGKHLDPNYEATFNVTVFAAYAHKSATYDQLAILPVQTDIETNSTMFFPCFEDSGICAINKELCKNITCSTTNESRDHHKTNGSNTIWIIICVIGAVCGVGVLVAIIVKLVQVICKYGKPSTAITSFENRMYETL